MHSISKRYRKPKSRPSKKSRASVKNICKRWSSVNVDSSEKNADTVNEHLSDDITINGSSTSNTVVNTAVENKTVSVSKLNESFPSTSDLTENVSEKCSYIFMNNDMWSSLLCNVKCDECCMNSLDVISKGTFGYSTKIELLCKNCHKVFSSVFSSPRVNDTKCFDANKKLVEAFLKIGKGHAALEVFSMAIGIHAMDKKTFSKCLHSLYEEKKSFKDDILQISRNVVRKKHEEINFNLVNKEIIDITVSFDGTWHKRGHTSLYGIGIVIDILTGLVIDYAILSKYCPECVNAKRDLGVDSAEFNIWLESHKPECCNNYAGSSNSMEMAAAEILWNRSINNCGMRYIGILSDGDAKTYQHLLDLNVYGKDIKISKEECINHVSKRLGTGLRNKVKEWRSKGVTIGGRKHGSLKEDTILKLTNFYRKAIKDNIPNVQNMKTAIYATLFHCSSTDKFPKHNKCPTGVTSWCFYQRSLASNEKPKSHATMKTKLSEEVLSKILPVYQRLASNELLSRCISGKTQNANESLHSVIWNKCPKEIFVSKKRLEMAVISSISEFNFGCLNSLGIEQEEINSFSVSIAQRRDKRRIDQSEKRSSTDWKKRRINKKICKTVKNNQKVNKEGETYSAGGF